jgi:hypothetical protein
LIAPPSPLQPTARISPRSLPLSRARIQLAKSPTLLNGRAREPTSFSDTEPARLRSRSPIGVWCRLAEPGTRSRNEVSARRNAPRPNHACPCTASRDASAY